MKTSVRKRQIFETGSGSSIRIPIKVRFIFTIFTVAGLLGCSLDSLMSFISSPPTPTSAQIESPTDTRVPDSPTMPPPSSTPQPTFTEQPTYTPFPTYTLLPTYPPLPTYTPLPSLTVEIVYYPTVAYPTYPSYVSGECCTLRVRNAGKVLYWIGTKMPYGGNYIEPGYYVEFYMHQPTFMWIQWCRVYSHNGKLHDCNKKYVYLNEDLEIISIP